MYSAGGATPVDVWNQVSSMGRELNPGNPLFKEGNTPTADPAKGGMFETGGRQDNQLEDLLETGDIPVVQIDRGGQVTFHGPGQLMIYPLIDLRRRGLGVRDLVTALEQSVVDLAGEFGIDACSRSDAPGVYVDGVKIASIGLRK